MNTTATEIPSITDGKAWSTLSQVIHETTDASAIKKELNERLHQRTQAFLAKEIQARYEKIENLRQIHGLIRENDSLKREIIKLQAEKSADQPTEAELRKEFEAMFCDNELERSPTGDYYFSLITENRWIGFKNARIP